MEFDINPLTILKDQLNSALTSFIESAPQLIAALAFLFFTWLIKVIVVKVFIKATTRSGLRPSLQEALRKIIVIGIWGIGILIAAMIAMPGLTPTKLLAGLGIGSIAIGLAFKDTFENLLAGLLLLMREPMRIDD